MRLRSLSLLAVMALTGSAGILHGQAPGSIEVGAYGQVTRVDPSQARFESTVPLSLGIRGSVNLHRHVGVELEASTGTVEGSGAPLARRRYNQLVARGTWTRPLSEYSGLVLGAGLARSDYEVTYNFGPSVLVGVRTLIRGRYALRSDVLFNYLPTSGAREFGLRTGVQTLLGPFAGPTTRDRRGGNRTVQEPGSLEAGIFVQARSAPRRMKISWKRQKQKRVLLELTLSNTSQLAIRSRWAMVRSESLPTTSASSGRSCRSWLQLRMRQ